MTLLISMVSTDCLLIIKSINEWIIAVGKHKGFISIEHWIETQEFLAAIAEKYNRPHRKTNAFLAGLVHCPICGKRLRVISESDRWTNGKPRFKYVCPGYQKRLAILKKSLKSKSKKFWNSSVSR